MALDGGQQDPYIGLKIGKYVVEKRLGEGQIGRVYKAVDRSVNAIVASKFIPNPREGWQNEITKVTSLQGVPHVVSYRDNGYVKVQDQEVLYILWDFIPGRSLREVAQSEELEVHLLSAVVEAVLTVLGACQDRDVVHADLHWGNILIQDSDPAIRSDDRRIWVTDFGYCTASMGTRGGKTLLDDLKGLARIISQCTECVDFHSLSARERHVYRALKEEFPKYLHETSRVEADYARNARELLAKWSSIRLEAEAESTGAARAMRIDDYPAAEMIGERWAEWKSLFVPKCIGVRTLTSRNIVVLTGVRGCGKSMLFRRLTASYDLHLGSSGVPGGTDFLGFYMNARYLAEAFPWLPEEKENEARHQILHYFHICWCLEILDWLVALPDEGKPSDCLWLAAFLRERLPQQERARLVSLSYKGIWAFLGKERERSRLKTEYRASTEEWTLTSIDFLSQFWDLVAKHVPQVADRPMHCFLDDYSTPLVSPTLQRILNPIVFSRRATVFSRSQRRTCGALSEQVWVRNF
jgi:predicted Ser/Thr protein kinase